jgi:DNA-binding MarR family transcriptional regulator
MAGKGLLRKETGKHDRRKRRIFLTGEGKELLNKAIPLMKELEIEITEDLGNSELQTTINVLQSVQAKVMGAAPILT